MNPEQPSPEVEKIDNPIAAIQEGEQIICVIKRHPIGILYMYGLLLFLLAALAVILFVVAPNLLGGSGSSLAGISTAIFFILTIFSLVFAFIANYIYWGNSWVVTSDSITQISQISLFNKQSSQLSLKNVEDISSHKEGIFQHLFNYGSLKAETANERTRFLFDYCPNPNYYAQKIIDTHEKFAIYTKQAGTDGH